MNIKKTGIILALVAAIMIFLPGPDVAQAADPLEITSISVNNQGELVVNYTKTYDAGRYSGIHLAFTYVKNPGFLSDEKKKDIEFQIKSGWSGSVTDTGTQLKIPLTHLTSWTYSSEYDHISHVKIYYNLDGIFQYSKPQAMHLRLNGDVFEATFLFFCDGEVLSLHAPKKYITIEGEEKNAEEVAKVDNAYANAKALGIPAMRIVYNASYKGDSLKEINYFYIKESHGDINKSYGNHTIIAPPGLSTTTTITDPMTDYLATIASNHVKKMCKKKGIELLDDVFAEGADAFANGERDGLIRKKSSAKKIFSSRPVKIIANVQKAITGPISKALKVDEIVHLEANIKKDMVEKTHSYFIENYLTQPKHQKIVDMVKSDTVNKWYEFYTGVAIWDANATDTEKHKEHIETFASLKSNEIGSSVGLADFLTVTYMINYTTTPYKVYHGNINIVFDRTLSLFL